MIADFPIPRCMRLVPATGAVVLLHLPELPAAWRDLPAPSGRTQGEAVDEARHAMWRLSSTWLPGAAELASAPVLELQAIVPDGPFVSFYGRVFGHPEIPCGRLGLTSVVVGYDGRHRRWARTIGGWYRFRSAAREH